MWNRAGSRFVPTTGAPKQCENTGARNQEEDSPQNSAKCCALDAWVNAVNAKGGFGVRCWDLAFESAKV